MKALLRDIVFMMLVAFLVHDHYVFPNDGSSLGETVGEPHPLLISGCGFRFVSISVK